MQASTELRNIIAGWFTAIANGDLSWAERHISRRAGVRLVGTDPAEWLEGPRVAEFLREEVKALGGVVRVTVGEMEAYCEGSVGWGVANPILSLPDGRQFSPAGARFSTRRTAIGSWSNSTPRSASPTRRYEVKRKRSHAKPPRAPGPDICPGLALLAALR